MSDNTSPWTDGWMDEWMAGWMRELVPLSYMKVYKREEAQ